MQLPVLSPDVDWSICVRDAATSQVLTEVEPDLVQRTASIGKIFLLIEVARRAEEGSLDLGQELTRAPDVAVADSGLWYLLRQSALAIDDLCWLVGGFSDNYATNVLVSHVGVTSIAATSTSLGFEHSALLDIVRDDRGPEHPWTLSKGCAGELSDLLARLHRHEIVSPAVSARVLCWLAANADLSMVASAFGLDPLAHSDPDRGITLINKTGTISTVRADVGVVVGPAAEVAYAVVAGWSADGPDDPRDRVLAEMAAIGAAIRAHVGG